MIEDTLPLEENAPEVVETPQPDDIRSTIKAAIEAQRGSEEAVAKVQVTPEEKQRARDEAGRFAAEEKAKEAKEAKPAAAQPKAEVAAVDPAPPNDGVVRPPPGWSPKSKAAFDSLPPEVKADIVKREGEVNQGFARLQEYKGLEAFAERAKAEGTTLAVAVANYDRWERNFKTDPVTTALHMAKNLGISPVQWANAVLQKAGGVPQQAAIGQQPAQQEMPQIHPALLAKLQQLESTVMTREQREYEQQKAVTAQNVNAFFSDPANKYADNVSEEMVSLINQAKASGKAVSVADLASFYETACYMNPEVRALVINDHKALQSGSNPAKAIAQRAQQANKAVTGAPSRGIPPAGSVVNPDASIRDTIKAAIAAQREG